MMSKNMDLLEIVIVLEYKRPIPHVHREGMLTGHKEYDWAQKHMKPVPSRRVQRILNDFDPS